MALRLKLSSVCSPFVQLGSTTATGFSLSQQPCSVSKLGFHSLSFRLKRNSYPTRLVIRAARTESKGVTLGFRAPQFQVLTFPLITCLFIYSFIIYALKYGNNYLFYLFFFFLFFQLPEPLTGKVWTLEDFEACPALLVGPHFYSSFFLLFFLSSLFVTDYSIFLCYVWRPEFI